MHHARQRPHATPHARRQGSVGQVEGEKPWPSSSERPRGESNGMPGERRGRPGRRRDTQERTDNLAPRVDRRDAERPRAPSERREVRAQTTGDPGSVRHATRGPASDDARSRIRTSRRARSGLRQRAIEDRYVTPRDVRGSATRDRGSGTSAGQNLGRGRELARSMEFRTHERLRP